MSESAPTGWTIAALDSVCDKITDGTHRSPSMTPTGFLYVTSKNIRPFRLDIEERLYISEEDHKEIWSRCDVRLGDLLLTKDGANTGNAAINPLAEAFSLLSSVALIRPTRRLLDAGFLCQYLNSEPGRRRTTAAMDGLAIRRLTIQKIRDLNVPLPPLPEQRKIAAILSSIDELIEESRRVLAQRRYVRSEVVENLLELGLPGRGRGLMKKGIGRVPEGWELAVLSDVAEVQTGLAKGKQARAALSLPYLRVANVQDGFIDLTEVKTIQVESAQVERYRLRSGDVLFTEGGDADKLGRGAVWWGQIDPCLHQNHVFSVRPNPALMLPDFLALWSGSRRGKAYFSDCAKQTTNLASINSTQLKALPLPLPPLTDQRSITDIVACMNQTLELESREIRQMGALKAALSSRLLSGGGRVVPDEAAA